MSEWRETTLGEVATIKGGKRLPKGEFLTAKPNNHPYIRIRDLSSFKTVELNQNFEYVPETIFQGISRYITNSNDVLLSIVGTIGMTGVVGETLDMASLTENCVKIISKEDTLSDFIYYYLNSPQGKEEIKKGTVGAVQPKLPIKNIQNLAITLPPLEEQKAIADTLSILDRNIELNNQANKVLEEMAFSLFERLIDTSTCENVPLSHIAEINPKRVLAKKTVAKCIDMSKLSTSGSFPTGWENKAFSGGMKFQNCDTLLARITPCLENGKTAYVNFLDDGEVGFGSTEYIVISPKIGYCGEFFYCLARYPNFINYAVQNMNGTSGRQRVSASIIGEYIIDVPDFLLLEEFNRVVPTFFDVIRQNSTENMKLTEVRNTLLPKLMSGELRVPLEEV